MRALGAEPGVELVEFNGETDHVVLLTNSIHLRGSSTISDLRARWRRRPPRPCADLCRAVEVGVEVDGSAERVLRPAAAEDRDDLGGWVLAPGRRLLRPA
jgi:hypothetical protein